MTPLPLAIPLFAICAVSAACGIFYTVVWWRIARANLTLPRLHEALRITPGEMHARVCVIIPAHNEAAVIQTIARSLLSSDYPAHLLHLVFCLDRCTDDTEKLLRAVVDGENSGAIPVTIIVNTGCPEGWAGKTHAMWRGVAEVGDPALAGRTDVDVQPFDYLLFADADTIFTPGLIRAAVATTQRQGYDLLSLLPTLTCTQDFEKILQPAAVFELIRQFPLDLVNRPGSRRAFANGQFMLFSQAAYQKLGGHAAVKGELLEDLALARMVRSPARSMKLGVLQAGKLLACRMYADEAAFVRGWKRIFTESCRRRPARLRQFAWRLRITCTLLPVAALFTAVMALANRDDAPLSTALEITGILGYVQYGLVLSVLAGNLNSFAVSCFLFPYGAWRVGGIMLAAASDLDKGVGTTWGGKTYAREVRS